MSAIGETLVASYRDRATGELRERSWDLWVFGMPVAMLAYQNEIGLNRRVESLSVYTTLLW